MKDDLFGRQAFSMHPFIGYNTVRKRCTANVCFVHILFFNKLQFFPWRWKVLFHFIHVELRARTQPKILPLLGRNLSESLGISSTKPRHPFHQPCHPYSVKERLVFVEFGMIFIFSPQTTKMREIYCMIDRHASIQHNMSEN